ncbi:hypothetical protein Q4578_04000 [Shimia thalassica]|uniref:hypothetical protein n=1 Tax=Shimia thalassica TaxID=1715693 RepID=UPI0026E3DCBA|nr:hypothetical protein [Shimia thalassica]MDO6520732.1 hypothetical protein [Shimia thalassica]
MSESPIPPSCHRNAAKQGHSAGNSFIYNLITILGQPCGMGPLQNLLNDKPDVEPRGGETLYRWRDKLAVIVRDTGEVGQFATTLAIKRDDVVRAIAAVAGQK